jgi:exodeoxyribonuclease VII small subunit
MVSPDADLLRALGSAGIRGIIANSVLVLLTILPVAAILIASRDRVPPAALAGLNPSPPLPTSRSGILKTGNIAEQSMASFEESLRKLETIVEQLERGDLALEESLKLFEEGVGLSSACKKELDAAEGKVEMLVKQRDGSLKTEPFLTEK